MRVGYVIRGTEAITACTRSEVTTYVEEFKLPWVFVAHGEGEEGTYLVSYTCMYRTVPLCVLPLTLYFALFESSLQVLLPLRVVSISSISGERTIHVAYYTCACDN